MRATKNLKGLVVAGAVALGLSAMSAKPAAAVSTTADATATVVAPIAIAKTADLSFGTIAPTASAGSVELSTAGVRTPTNVTLVGSAGVTVASFSVTGGANATYTISVPGINLADGANTMACAFVTSPTPTGTLSGAGAETLLVGGTLTVGANQAVGSYTGTFTVTVAYN